MLTGVVAATQAGPAVSLSFVIAGIASAAAALCYAEFAGMIPVAGSAYTYAYAVLGELVAWAQVHPRFRTPHRPTLIAGGLTALVAGFFPIKANHAGSSPSRLMANQMRAQPSLTNTTIARARSPGLVEELSQMRVVDGVEIFVERQRLDDWRVFAALVGAIYYFGHVRRTKSIEQLQSEIGRAGQFRRVLGHLRQVIDLS